MKYFKQMAMRMALRCLDWRLLQRYEHTINCAGIGGRHAAQRDCFGNSRLWYRSRRARGGAGSESADGNKAVNSILGVGGALGLMNEAAKALGQNPNQGKSSGMQSGSRDGAGESKERDDRKAVDPEAAARASRTLAAIEAELQEIQCAKRQERDRNVDTAIRVFLDDLVSRHQALQAGNDRGIRSTRGELNQVTAGQIKVSIEDAYTKSSLREFDNSPITSPT